MTFQIRQCLIIACLVAFCVTASAQSPSNLVPSDFFNTWLNEQFAAKVNQTSNAKQAEMPSQSAASTSLVDQSSATDLVSAAFNLTGVSNNSSDGIGPKAGTVTASAYSLYALLKRTDPLGARFYNAHPYWRRVWFTVGNDNGSTSGTTTTPRATIAGIKVLLVAGRDISAQDPRIDRIALRLQDASVAFGQASTQIAIYLIRQPKVKSSILRPAWRPFLEQQLQTVSPEKQADIQAAIARFNANSQETIDHLFISDPSLWSLPELIYFAQFEREQLSHFGALLNLVGESGIADIDDITKKRIDVFSDLNSTVREEIEAIRRAPQFSVAFTSTTRPGAGANEYVAEGIFDYGVANRINLTLNSSFNYKDTKVLGGISRGSKFVGDVQFQLTPEKSLSGRGPMTFEVGTEGDWMTKAKPTYKGQVKIKVPIVSGIDFPISVTFASRSDLINEQDVVGKFGFTFDTARLLGLFSK